MRNNNCRLKAHPEIYKKMLAEHALADELQDSETVSTISEPHLIQIEDACIKLFVKERLPLVKLDSIHFKNLILGDNS